MDMDAILERWAMGQIPPEELPDLATEAIQAGWDSESLVLLAGLAPVDPRDARELFHRAVTELEWQVPTLCEALRRVVRRLAAEIVAGRLLPGEGASAIAGAIWRTNFWACPDMVAIGPRFAYLADLSDMSRDEATLEQIREAALALVREPS